MLLTNPKLSFCTTCRNRTQYLRQTILHNINSRIQGVDFILVNYGSTDDLDDFVLTELKEHLQSGILKYYRYPSAGPWHSCKAKNISHALADGDILFNLDCDNFISPILCKELLEYFESGDVVVFNADTPGIPVVVNGVKYDTDGTGGRIAISREDFRKLGGYDESFEPMGYQDNDLLKRCEMLGKRVIRLRQHAKAIQHPKGLGAVKPEDWPAMNERNKIRSEQNIANNRIIAFTDFSRILQVAERVVV